MEEICILIPTFAKYRQVAEFTRNQLDRYWTNHPPVFFSGAQGEGPDWLPFHDDPADWMQLLRSAVDELLVRGFDRCYLILDDHPPMDECHADHLNHTLPRLLNELGASFINLQGWGQYRPRQGKSLGSRYYHLEQSSRAYLWKFALHPGLWKLRALREILDLLLLNPDLREHTCWKFERRTGDREFPFPQHLLDTAYRVCGAAMAARFAPRLRCFLRGLERFFFDVLRYAIRILAGQPSRERFDARFLGVYHYYDGPYPMFWSGLMKKGRLNPDLLFYLKLHRRGAFLAELREAIPEPSAGD